MTVFTINDAFIRDLSEIVKTENIKVNEPLNAHTYTQMGGNADIFVTASRYEEVEQVVKFANEHNVPFTLILERIEHDYQRWRDPRYCVEFEKT